MGGGRHWNVRETSWAIYTFLVQSVVSGWATWSQIVQLLVTVRTNQWSIKYQWKCFLQMVLGILGLHKMSRIATEIPGIFRVLNAYVNILLWKIGLRQFGAPWDLYSTPALPKMELPDSCLVSCLSVPTLPSAPPRLSMWEQGLGWWWLGGPITSHITFRFVLLPGWVTTGFDSSHFLRDFCCFAPDI